MPTLPGHGHLPTTKDGHGADTAPGIREAPFERDVPMIPPGWRGLWPLLGLVATIALPPVLPAQGGSPAADERRTELRGFADFTAGASSDRGTPWSFGLGQYDLYLTSRLPNSLSFLGETVFEFDKGYVVDVERIIVTYAPRHYFRVAVGKHHTPIGYWNNAFHHGALLQPTIQRPQMVRFEDDGGVLPIHTTGVSVSGRDVSSLHLDYDVMVGNGIGSTPTADNNAAKSYTLALSTQVTNAFQFGASLYRDRIAAGTPSLAGPPVADDVDVRLLGGFATYLGSTVEVMAEYQRAEHRGRASTTTTDTDALYAYAGYRMGRFVPYLRYDELRLPPADSYFGADDFQQTMGGVRYDVAAGAGLKAEYARRKTGAAGRVTLLTLQLAVGF